VIVHIPPYSWSPHALHFVPDVDGTVQEKRLGPYSSIFLVSHLMHPLLFHSLMNDNPPLTFPKMENRVEKHNVVSLICMLPFVAVLLT